MKRSVTRIRTSAVGLLVSSTVTCMPVAERVAPGDEHILVDTSGSIRDDVFARIQHRVVQDVLAWVQRASPTQTFSVWYLTDDHYPAQLESITMPALTVPAYNHRRRLARQFVQRIETIFEQMPRNLGRTKMLESVYFIASTRHADWNLRIYSDLAEDSPAFDAALDGVDIASQEDVVRAMLSILPHVRVPPASVTLLSWPGLTTTTREYDGHRALWYRFMEQWAPDAKIANASL